jgi:hypothetical protein
MIGLIRKGGERAGFDEDGKHPATVVGRSLFPRRQGLNMFSGEVSLNSILKAQNQRH